MDQSIPAWRRLPLTLTLALVTPVAWAQGVLVNGVAPNLLEMLVLVEWNCGQGIPPGNYWVNVENGAWGYAGGAQQGQMRCHPAAQAGAGTVPAQEAPVQESDCERQYRVHEDRMCYCYHVC